MRVITDPHLARKHLTNMLQCVPSYEYLWDAAWCFFEEGDPAAERWVAEKMRAVLDGQASTVAAAIRRKATRLQLDTDKRKNADNAADYLLAKRPYLDYPTALTNGWPIATGVIEGACRHLVKDRMDITGARWGLDGAEAVLKLRLCSRNGHAVSALRTRPFSLIMWSSYIAKCSANCVVPGSGVGSGWPLVR